MLQKNKFHIETQNITTENQFFHGNACLITPTRLQSKNG